MNYYIDDFFSINTREELTQFLDCDAAKELYCFFADPANHSLSPKMYNSAFDDMGMNKFYFAAKVPAGMIGEAIEKALEFDIKGFNVSMPHKEKIIDYLADVDVNADLCGAVNTVIQRTNHLGQKDYKGFNTDAYGFVKAVEVSGLETENLSAVILGLGGAGKAAVVGLASKGADVISIFVRRPDNKGIAEFLKKLSYYYPETVFKLYDLSNAGVLKEEIQSSQLLANCTSVGMGVFLDESLIPDISYLHKNLTVMDVIYMPSSTKLLDQAKGAGCKYYKNGIDMLIYQGEAAFNLYTGEQMPDCPSIRNQ